MSEERLANNAAAIERLPGDTDPRPVILSIRGISKIYESVNALQNINLDVHKGEWVSIMGSSGSGKTTMMNIIGCMDKPSAGSVYLDGQDITKKNQHELTTIRREKIGLVFQQFHLIQYLTAVENVMVAQYYHSMPDEKEALAALAKVGLEKRAKHLPNQLSGGEQQRVCIARALINNPEIILADEPTGNLDEANENIVIGIMRELHKEGATIIVVTHDPEVGEEAERKVVLDYGKIKEIVTLKH
ncbi:ABC transporter ATP-binding protein [Mageeibacillus indolicus]|uniref:ABC transporter, ATP-binding protein n=1 Tax=Mageeibacillus indolicus (strain UPII9-5) TaxID=699246 RepID=D3R069_MAGIU|nr:ABC transporter ATP-binding protein [Mageeibacillus indolicus]ADC91315.1 ABC transporter, ATP-binding protein [Mageeibacillus indolicus UPII9-5]